MESRTEDAVMGSAKITRSPGNRVLTYTVGFVLSILLTLAAYSSVVNRTHPDSTLIGIIVGLAVTQLLVQLVFFLHLGRESKPRWKLMIFLWMLLIVGIVVGGSLWIMQNLDYNMMPQDMDTRMIEEEGIAR